MVFFAFVFHSVICCVRTLFPPPHLLSQGTPAYLGATVYFLPNFAIAGDGGTTATTLQTQLFTDASAGYDSGYLFSPFLIFLVLVGLVYIVAKLFYRLSSLSISSHLVSSFSFIPRCLFLFPLYPSLPSSLKAGAVGQYIDKTKTTAPFGINLRRCNDTSRYQEPTMPCADKEPVTNVRDL